MKVISLFAGIGGFDLAFKRAGAHVVAHVELNPDARAVLNLQFPDALSFSDVRSVGRHNLPSCDILCGGFPCQDLSVAGNRAGLAGARSGLFYEMVRITDELRPAFLLWENVPGLLSSDGGRDFARILRALDDIGYSGAWTGLDAQFFGLAQRRQRIFGLWARDDIGAEPCTKILALAARLPWNTQARPEARADVAGAITAGAHPGSYNGQDAYTGNVIAFDSKGVNAAEGSVAPTQRATVGGGAGRMAVSIAENQRGELRTAGIASQLTTGGGKPGQGYPAVLVADTLTANYARQIDSRDSNQGPPNLLIVAATLNSGGNNGGFRTEPGEHIVAVRTANTSANGHGIAENMTHTLDGAQGQAVSSGFGVRRLTPLECERLQGFPDDWTKYRKSDGTLRNMREMVAWIADRESGVNRTEQSDSARYRQLGNAVAVPVVEWIAGRLTNYLRSSSEAASARRAQESGAYAGQTWMEGCLDALVRRGEG